MLRRLNTFFLAILFLTACTPGMTPTPVSVVTEEPTLQVVSSPVLPSTTTPSPLPPPSETPLPTLVFPTPIAPVDTLEPSATPQLSPAHFSAVIQILSPGPLSKVLSPFKIRAYVIPGARQLVSVELIGEDERLIYRKLTYVFTEYKWAYLTLDIPFETHAAAELGRLQVSTVDAHGNTSALLSVHLILQQEGFEELNPSGNLNERCTLLTPLPGMEAFGGVLQVGGQFRPFNTQPLILELSSEDGNTIYSNRWVNVPEDSVGKEMTFSTDLPYSVDSPISARLVVRQWDDRIDGVIYLYSQPVKLNP